MIWVDLCPLTSFTKQFYVINILRGKIAAANFICMGDIWFFWTSGSSGLVNVSDIIL